MAENSLPRGRVAVSESTQATIQAILARRQGNPPAGSSVVSEVTPSGRVDRVLAPSQDPPVVGTIAARVDADPEQRSNLLDKYKALKVFGRPLHPYVQGMIIGGGSKWLIKQGLLYVAGGPILPAVAAGGSSFIFEGLKDIRDQRKEFNEMLKTKYTEDQLKQARDEVREKFKLNKGRTVKVAGIGAAKAAIGSVVASEFLFPLASEYGGQILDFAKNHWRGILSSNPIGGGVVAIHDVVKGLSESPQSFERAMFPRAEISSVTPTPLPESYNGIVPASEIDAAGGRYLSSSADEMYKTMDAYFTEKAGRGLSQEEWKEAQDKIFEASGLNYSLLKGKFPKDAVLHFDAANEYLKKLHDVPPVKVGYITDEFGEKHYTTGVLTNHTDGKYTWTSPGEQPKDVTDQILSSSTPTETPTSTPSRTPLPSRTPVPAGAPAALTETPTASPTVEPTKTFTPRPYTPTPTPSPSETPAPSPTPEPNPSPAAAPKPAGTPAPAPQAGIPTGVSAPPEVGLNSGDAAEFKPFPTEGSYARLINLHKELNPEAPAAAVGRFVNQPGSADLSVQLTNQALQTVGLDEKNIDPKVLEEVRKSVQRAMEVNTQGHFDNVAKEVLEGKRPFNAADFDFNKITFPRKSYFPYALREINHLSSTKVLPSISAEQIAKAPALFELNERAVKDIIPGTYEKLASVSDSGLNPSAPSQTLEEFKAVPDQITNDTLVAAGLDPNKVPEVIKEQIKNEAKTNIKSWVDYEYNRAAQHLLENPKLDPKIAMQVAHDRAAEVLKVDHTPQGYGSNAYIDTKARLSLTIKDLIKDGKIPLEGNLNIPKEVFSIPGVEQTTDGFTLSLKEGSNPWEEARKVGGAILNPDHSPLAEDDERVRAIAKKLVEQSAGYNGQAGIKVPGWDETSGPNFTLNHLTEVKAGYKLNFNKDVLNTIKGFAKSAESNVIPFPTLANKDLDLAA